MVRGRAARSGKSARAVGGGDKKKGKKEGARAGAWKAAPPLFFPAMSAGLSRVPRARVDRGAGRRMGGHHGLGDRETIGGPGRFRPKRLLFGARPFSALKRQATRARPLRPLPNKLTSAAHAGSSSTAPPRWRAAAGRCRSGPGWTVWPGASGRRRLPERMRCRPRRLCAWRGPFADDLGGLGDSRD